MIKACEDVETLEEYYEFCAVFFNTKELGLKETCTIICWYRPNIIDPELFTRLQKEC